MTESDPKTYHIISKNFEDKAIEFIEQESDIWITAEALGFGLEYINPRKDIMQLYYRHKDEIEDYSSILKLSTEAGMRETTVFNEMGAYLLIMFSNQPKAKLFRKWVINVIKEIRRKGYYIEKSDDPYDLLVRQAELIKKAFIDLKEQNEKICLIETKVSNVDSELKSFEDKYENEKGISPQTRKKIKDLVHECVKNSGLHWNHFWPKIWKAFEITTTTDISEKLGLKIIKWINTNPYFNQFLN